MWHLPLLGVGVFLAWRKAGQPAKGVLTPQVNYLYNSILSHKDITPDQLRAHAKNFEQSGYKYQAKILVRRAAHKENSTLESIAAERELLAKTYKSNNPNTIRKIAAMFEQIGSVGCSSDLLHHADDVERKNRIQVVETTIPAPPIPETKIPESHTNGVSVDTIGPDKVPAETPPPAAAPAQAN